MAGPFTKETFSQAMEELGVEMAWEPFSALVRARPFGDPKYTADALYVLAHEALHGPHGYAWKYGIGETYLVARDGDRLVIGIQSSNAKRPFPPWGWKITRWSKDLAKNRPQVAAWAKTETKGVVSGTLVRPPAREDGNAEEGAALLAAIVANPEDAAARLVYADWLLERGDARGELIRLHQEGKPTGDLARKHAAVMLGPYASFDDGTRADSGFVEELVAFAGKLAKHPEVFEREPFRTMQLIAMKEDDLAKVAKSCGAYLGRITALHLEARKAPRYMARVKAKPAVIAPLFTGLRALGLERLDETLAEWRAFFRGLTGPIAELSIDAVPRAVFGIFEEPVLPKLRKLHVGYQSWCSSRGRADAVAVAKIIAKRNLDEVSISSWHPGDAAIGEVVEALLAARRCKITIDNCTMAADTRRALAKRARVTVTR